MRHNYTLVIEDDNYERYKKLASFLFLINAVIFFMLALRSVSVSGKLILFTSAILVGAYAVYNWRYKKRKENSFVVIYGLIAAVWVTDTPYWYFAILFLILLFLQYKMEQYFTIHIMIEKVEVNGFWKKQYEWNELNNLILKDDLLTIDQKNDKMLQVRPDWKKTNALSEDTDDWDYQEDYRDIEKEFNDFCRAQLTK